MIAAIALGSNLRSRWGEPADALQEAIKKLEALGTVTAVSSFYQTDPVGLLDQPRFRNAALLLDTQLTPSELMAALLQLEAALGRVRTADAPPKGPRVIDLDLLLCVDDDGTGVVVGTSALILPHQAMHERRFVLEPLAEIAPEIQHPVLGKTVRQLFNELAAAAPPHPQTMR